MILPHQKSSKATSLFRIYVCNIYQHKQSVILATSRRINA